jgi:transglutaminase-like putative cysteine protease
MMLRRRRDEAVTRERRSETPGVSSEQLSWLIASILLTGAPHLLHVHPWVPVVVVTLLFWRFIAASRRWSLPGAWLRVPLTLLGFGGVLLSYRQVSGLSAGSALLLIMAAMKLLETRGHRDRAIVIFICYFLLFATFLREQAIWSSAYLVIGILVTTAALIQIARIGSVVSTPAAMAYAARLMLQSLPIALLLFLLFPRIPGPFWSLPHTGDQAVSGLSGELNPGDISELALSDKVAFRVRFNTAPTGTSQLYWRGPVMDTFDGQKWTQGQVRPPGTSSLPNKTGPLIDYEVTLEPHGQHWLLALETPVTWDARGAGLSSTGQLLRNTPVERRLSYRSTSVLGTSHRQDAMATVLSQNRKLPEQGNPRSIAFARQLRTEVASDAEYLQKLLQYFSAEPFYYTLRPPSLGADPVDEFLFDTRRGFCGHYASAFTLLARAGGIPTRVVTGYQGAEQNPLGDYWIVRQSDAHAWTEAWIDDRWVRFDPTAMVAPDRIEYGFDAAMESRNESRGDLLSSNQLLVRAMLGWDAVSTGWNRWILGFGPESQSTLMSLIGIRHPTIEHLVIIMTLSITALLIIIGIAQRYRARPRLDDLLIAYNSLCQRTGKIIRARRSAEGPDEYLAALCIERPDLSGELRALFSMYVRLRYDGSNDVQLRHKFFADIKAFRPVVQPAVG